mmetsp:Transcript_45554/g.33306  ORF Transcript_45554/g.33306 Transcript_45554/m.33306 type:complete len:82 (+) Transcript_45554:95-340(+)
MAGSKGEGPFGIEGYRIPDCTAHLYRPRSTKIPKYNIPHFIDKYAKDRSFVPGPVYEVVPDWRKSLKGQGKFSTSPRVTFT